MSGPIAGLVELLPALWWPFCRFVAALTVAPLLGEAMVPARVRIGAALALAVAVQPALRGTPAIDPFSLYGVIVAFEQVVIGLVFGMALQLVMTVLSLLGFLVSSQMGLSMAVMNDPGNGSSSDVVSTLLYLLGALLFFAIDGHLVLVQIVHSSFVAWPVGGGVDAASLRALAGGLGWAFSAAVLLALPAVFATFVVQVGFGLINRVAPALNLFSLGFPLVTLFGLGTLSLLVRFVPEQYLRLTDQILKMIEAMLGGGRG
ncbi:flagellar biosynthetic protein FliR [Crenobacter luteus]|uniref:flagellar biosynthetic protein FliR n=1 Tax=Crenobacter luteus TaxID=1452487 RepID=UPI001049BC1F|nr:flagellar biosynthetic protein FliR [Crenobacter luteus]TCP15593.1 flagellar biosynthetic protein FliR [Crenobacter luteus]